VSFPTLTISSSLYSAEERDGLNKPISLTFYERGLTSVLVSSSYSSLALALYDLSDEFPDEEDKEP